MMRLPTIDFKGLGKVLSWGMVIIFISSIGLGSAIMIFFITIIPLIQSLING